MMPSISATGTCRKKGLRPTSSNRYAPWSRADHAFPGPAAPCAAACQLPRLSWATLGRTPWLRADHAMHRAAPTSTAASHLLAG